MTEEIGRDTCVCCVLRIDYLKVKSMGPERQQKKIEQQIEAELGAENPLVNWLWTKFKNRI